MLDFHFPLTSAPDELEQTDSHGSSYTVQSQHDVSSMDEEDISAQLHDIQEVLQQTPHELYNNEHFDYLYHTVQQYQRLAPTVQMTVVNVLTTGLTKLIVNLKSIVQQQPQPAAASSRQSLANDDMQDDTIQQQMVQTSRNALKMYVYLTMNVLEQIQQISAHNQEQMLDPTSATATAAASKASKAKASKSKSKKQQIDTTAAATTLEPLQVKEQLCTVLIDMLLSQHTVKLFPMSTYEPEIGIYMFKTLSTLADSIDMLPAKNRTVRDCIFLCLTLTVKKFHLNQKLISYIVHTLTNNTTNDNMPAHLAELIRLIVKDYEVSALVNELLNAVLEIDSALLVRDTAASRSVSQFLVECTALLPHHILLQLPLLHSYLDDNNYQLRNGCVQVMGLLIEKGFERSLPAAATEDDNVELIDGLTPAHHDTREQLYDILKDRIHDVSSFTRSKTLQVWISLAKAKKITLQRYESVIRSAIDRLEDKASQVRKYALILLTTLLQYQMIGPSLDGNLFNEVAQRQMKAFEADMEKLQVQNQKDEQRRVSMKVEVRAEDGSDTNARQQYNMTVQQSEAFAQRQLQIKLLMETCKIIEQFQRVVPLLTPFLHSVHTTDIIEAIEYLVTAKSFKLQEVDAGIKQMLALVWSSEQSVREGAIEAYKRIYLSVDLDQMNSALAVKASLDIARQFIALTQNATLAELTSLEELVLRLIQNKCINTRIIQSLWNLFQSTTVNDSIRVGALIIISMMAKERPEVLKENLEVMVGIGLTPASSASSSSIVNPFYLNRVTCIALQQLTVQDLPAEAIPVIHRKLANIITSTVDISINPPNSQQAVSTSTYYYTACEQALNTLFHLHPTPDIYATELLKSMIKTVLKVSTGDNSGSNEQLARLFHVAGHLAIKILIQIEQYESAIKKLKQKSSTLKLAKAQSDAADAAMVDGSDDEGANGKAKGKKTKAKPRKSTGKANGKPEAPTAASIEDELANVQSEEYELEVVRDMAEHSLVNLQYTRTQNTATQLLALLSPLLIRICTQPQLYKHSHLRASATLALCKFMTISSEYCHQHIQLLFSLLVSSKDINIKSNLIIAIGDLAYRFPNIVEPYSEYMYVGLTDTHTIVRKHTLLVLTHLILNDMLKVRTPIADLAQCICDTDHSIQNLTKAFFSTLSEKLRGSVIYNVLPDVISRLSSNAQIDDSKFQTIMKYLFTFISKDKQTEALVEKLCLRFQYLHVESEHADTKPTLLNHSDGSAVRVKDEDDVKMQEEQKTADMTTAQHAEMTATASLRHGRHLAYCLSQLNYTATSIKKLHTLFTVYASKLGDNEIYSYFTDIINKSRKFSKADVKTMLDELEAKLEEAHIKAVEEIAADRRAQRVGKTGKAPARQRVQRDATVDDEEAAEGEDADAEEDGDKENEANDDNVDAGDDIEESKEDVPVPQRNQRGTKSTARKVSVTPPKQKKGSRSQRNTTAKKQPPQNGNRSQRGRRVKEESEPEDEEESEAEMEAEEPPQGDEDTEEEQQTYAKSKRHERTASSSTARSKRSTITTATKSKRRVKQEPADSESD